MAYALGMNTARLSVIALFVVASVAACKSSEPDGDCVETDCSDGIGDDDDAVGDDDDDDDDTSPGAYEGYGAVTRGHEDCPDPWEEVVVTSLEDSGPGSLREALSDGCRLVTFELGGTITLASSLNLPYSHVTIDGSSAPEPGITILQPDGVATTLEAGNSTGPISDVIIHHLRMDGLGNGPASDLEGADIWGLDGEKNQVSRIIIDHVTAKGARDGVFDFWEDVDDVTLSWNLMFETVKMMHMSTNDITSDRHRVSIHHNVFSGNNERQIRMRHDSEVDYVNNVIWGWGWYESGAAGLHIAYNDSETNPSGNVIGNVFHYVEGLDGDPDDAIRWEQGADVGTFYFEDNALPGGEGDAVSNGTQQVIPSEAQVTTYAAAALGSEVVPSVGTHYPTAAETALLEEIAAGI